MYIIKITKQAQKDVELIKRAGYKQKVEKLLAIIERNPLETPPMYEKLSGNLEGYYSRRINIQHRLVYEFDEQTNVVKILRMWSHYEFWCQLSNGMAK